MPNKTIYVADADLAVFEQAQELAGENLSATIAQALRRFVEVEEARSRGFDLVTLKVGNKGMHTNKQFLGRELAKQRTHEEEPRKVKTSVVFQTAKERFVLYVRTSPDWNAWTGYWMAHHQDEDWDRDWDVDIDVEVDVSPHAHTKDMWEAWRRERRRQRGRNLRRFDWSNWTSGSEYTMEVYDTLDELKPHISDELFAAVEHALRGEDVEFLDI